MPPPQCGRQKQLQCCIKTNEDKPILSEAEMNARLFSFWHYEFYADIRGGLWGGGDKQPWMVENDFLCDFGVCCLEKL